MATRPELPLSYRTLHASPLVRVSGYRCRACQGGPAAEEHNDESTIVFLRHGAFRQHFGSRSVTADVNQAMFFSRGSSYRVSHPTDCGDSGTVIAPSARVLAEIQAELDPDFEDGEARAFAFVTGPCSSELHWRHHEFVRRLEARDTGAREPLWADVTALQLAADALHTAHVWRGVAKKPRRRSTGDDHAERAQAAKAWLAQRLGERVSLSELARAVHCSPFHFARLFQRQTGLPVHRYLTRLRLRAALERLLDGADDLTQLALEVGFSSHSHFTETFRREFGCTPSRARRQGRRAVRETSKTPIV